MQRSNLILPILLLMVTLVVACSSESHEPEHPPVDQVAPFDPASIAVRGMPLNPVSTPIPIVTSGKIAAGTETHLAVKIGGIIEQLYADEGDLVRKGQVLARIGQPEIGAQVSQAQSGLEKAQRDLDRAQRLYADTVITLEQLQNLTTAKEVAEAQMQQARASVGYAKLYAPATGKVLRRMVERGEFAAPGTPLFRIETKESHATIRAGLTDREIVRVQKGDTAQVELDAYPGKQFKGLVTDLGETPHPATGLFEVELSLDDEGKPVRNGFVARIRIFPLQQSSYYRIPVDAIVGSEEDALMIYTLDSSRKIAEPRHIHRYEIEDQYVIVEATEVPDLGFVITDGAHYVEAGSTVRVLESEGPAGMAISQ